MLPGYVIATRFRFERHSDVVSEERTSPLALPTLVHQVVELAATPWSFASKSWWSRSGECFTVADGSCLTNEAETGLPSATTDWSHGISSTG